MCKKAEASFWTAKEINLSVDLTDRVRLSNTKCLAFVAASDGILNKNLSSNFVTKVTAPEAQFFYGFQIAIKNIHTKTYSLFIDTYTKDPKEKLHLLDAIKIVPCIQRKANWALKWCNSTNASFAKCMIAFVTVKGIFFSGSFCSIFWLKKRRLVPGLSFSNELSAATKDSTATVHASFTLN